MVALVMLSKLPSTASLGKLVSLAAKLPVTGFPGLHEPPAAFTPDPPRNRASARRLGELRPRLACFGHGPPLRDPGKLADFIAGLPE